MKAALELFAERGFHGAPVGLIAKKAGVGAGTIYRYFPDKEAMVNALFRHWKRRMAQEVLDHLEGDLPIREQFGQYWQCMVAFARKHPKVITFMELHHHASYLDQQSEDLCIFFEDKTAVYFNQAREDQIVKDVDPKLLMVIIKGAFMGLQKAVMAGELEPSEEMDQAAEQICWEAVRR